jgi:hypothetical protein
MQKSGSKKHFTYPSKNTSNGIIGSPRASTEAGCQGFCSMLVILHCITTYHDKRGLFWILKARYITFGLNYEATSFKSGFNKK